MRHFDFEKNTGKVLSLWICRLQTGCFMQYLQIQQLSKTLKTPAFICLQYQCKSIFSILNQLCTAASVHSCSTAWGVWRVAVDELSLRWDKKGSLLKKKKSTPALFCPTSVTVHMYLQGGPRHPIQTAVFDWTAVCSVEHIGCWCTICFND